MQNANEIRAHIAAVRQTRKITNAMHLVASSRLKKVMSHIEYNNAYFSRVQATMKDILQSSESVTHEYLTGRGGERRTYIVVAGDKGLAGAYNANVLNLAYETISQRKEKKETYLLTVGLVATEFFRARGMQPDIETNGAVQDPSLSNARKLAFDIFDLYDDDLTDEVYIIYTSFYGDTKNRPVIRRLLPIVRGDYEQIAAHKMSDIIYEPSAQELFSLLVPQYVTGILFGALVQAYAAEHFARMNAMQSATRNADEMLKKLQTQYNMARQAAITQEITEIAGAAEALLHGGEELHAKR